MPTVKTNRSITITPSCVHFPIVLGQYALPNDTFLVVDYGGGRRVTIDWVQVWTPLHVMPLTKADGFRMRALERRMH